MRVTVLGGSGAWPTVDAACSGFLVEYGSFKLVIDMGYATFPRLLRHIAPEQVDAVLISHGHPDHCADLNPLLRARALGDNPPPGLPLYCLPGALDAVLALDPPHMLANAAVLREFDAGACIDIGPFGIETRLLPHFVPNAGFRVTTEGNVLAYTGDTGPSPQVVELARDADVLIAEATFPWDVPEEDADYLTSAIRAGRQATDARVRHLMLTHLWPGTDPVEAKRAAGRSFDGPMTVASSGVALDLE